MYEYLRYIGKVSYPSLLSRGTPCDINAIYTLLKNTFSGLQFRSLQYVSAFIRLAVIVSETREM